MIKWNKWWVWLIGCIIFLSIVQILFSIPAPCKFLEAVWSAGDFITFVGTVVLGCVAVSQTQRANEMSEKLMDIENNRYKLEIRPFVMVTDYKAYELYNNQLLFAPDKLYIQIGEHKDSEMALGIGLRIQNTTESYLTVEYCGGYAEQLEWSNSATNQPNRKLRLLAGKSAEMVFYASPEYMQELIGKFITVEFILENRFAERYKESFQIIITTLSNKCVHKEGQWYLDCAIQTFKIGKFRKLEDGKTILQMEDIADV